MDRNDNGLIIFDKLVMAAIDALLLPALQALSKNQIQPFHASIMIFFVV